MNYFLLFRKGFDSCAFKIEVRQEVPGGSAAKMITMRRT